MSLNSEQCVPWIRQIVDGRGGGIQTTGKAMKARKWSTVNKAKQRQDMMNGKR